MPSINFILQTILISLSGVIAPGPVTAVTLGKGNCSPHAGAIISLGHGLVEFPLMIVLFFGFGAIFKLAYVEIAIAFIGGILLLFMGIGMLKDMKTPEVAAKPDKHSPLTAGILLTAGNPYFLLWWATVGVAFIMQSTGFGLYGFLVFAIAHWLCDFVWLYFLSAISYKGGRFFGRRFQQIVFGVCGVMLLFFGGKFLFNAAIKII